MRRAIFLLFVFVALFTSQFNLCQGATTEETNARMKRIDGQVKRIDREITAMKNQLQMLDRQEEHIYSILRNWKIYPINYKGELRFALTEAQVRELAYAMAIDCLLWNVGGPECPGDQENITVDYFIQRIKIHSLNERRELDRILRYVIPEKEKEIERDLAQQQKEMQRLTEEFLLLDASLGASKSAGVLPKGREVFHAPEAGGIRVDGCLYWTKQCGNPAADKFCREKGYSKSYKWGIDHNVTKTKCLGDGKICETGKNHPNCGAFSFIECE